MQPLPIRSDFTGGYKGPFDYEEVLSLIFAATGSMFNVSGMEARKSIFRLK